MCLFSVSPLSLLKNPMILLAVVALGFTFGMPKLMENSTFSDSFPSPCLLRNNWKADIWFLL